MPQTPQVYYNPDEFVGTYLVRVNDLEQAKNVACWGTYGLNGSHPLRWVRLLDCSTSHLQEILRTQPVGDEYKEIITSILKDRGIRS